MKRVGNWWIDENNNKWNAHLYTKNDAENYSKTLINCINCDSCDNCQNCVRCQNCDNCVDCVDCQNCVNCDSCDNCQNCVNCDNCNGYVANPSRYITKNIGSRYSQTHFYYGKTKEDSMSIQIKCGCFHGDLKEFAKAVEKTHRGNEYGEQYRKEIEKVKMLFDLED